MSVKCVVMHAADTSFCCSLAGHCGGEIGAEVVGDLRRIDLVEAARRMRQAVAELQRVKRERLEAGRLGSLDYFPCWYCMRQFGKTGGLEIYA